MSKLVFDGDIYILKRNSLLNVLFIVLVLYTLLYYYTNYQNLYDFKNRKRNVFFQKL